MPRAPFNVHVLPFRRTQTGAEYVILKRSDAGIWQGIAGGGEVGETPLQAAQRESFEDCGIPYDSQYLKLDSVTPNPVVYFNFPESHLWGEDRYVIPQYAFGVDATGYEIVLSAEHVEYRWLPYEQAHELLYYHNNKNDLWELNQRLKGKGPRGLDPPVPVSVVFCSAAIQKASWPPVRDYLREILARATSARRIHSDPLLI